MHLPGACARRSPVRPASCAARRATDAEASSRAAGRARHLRLAAVAGSRASAAATRVACPSHARSRTSRAVRQATDAATLSRMAAALARRIRPAAAAVSPVNAAAATCACPRRAHSSASTAVPPATGAATSFPAAEHADLRRRAVAAVHPASAVRRSRNRAIAPLDEFLPRREYAREQIAMFLDAGEGDVNREFRRV